MKVICPYCNADAELVTGHVVYRSRPDLAHKNFWYCGPCQAWVGCHQEGAFVDGVTSDGTLPLGRLANNELRKAKMVAHSSFDALWKSGRMKRRQAYAWLAATLKISPDEAHIGMFDITQCQTVIDAVRKFK